MKSIVIEKNKKVAIKDVKAKPKCENGYALLKLLYGGICGSDLNTYRGGNAYAVYPCIPGHEFSAQIVEISKNDKGFKVGDIVTANPYFNCGKCYSCKKGLLNACQDNKTMGVQREGAFSEFVEMPIERLYHSQGISPRLLALVEPFCIGYHGAKRANIQPNDNVLIIGAGTIGVFAGLAAKSFGAKVTICDIAKDKLDYAFNTFHFDDKILNAKNADFEKIVAEKTCGNGFDVAIEAVGFSETFKNCIDAAAFGGRVVLIGIPKTPMDNFLLSLLQKKELSVFGSRNALKSDFEDVIKIVQSGKFPIEKVITNEYSWLDAEKGFSDFDLNAGKMLKVLLKF